MASDKAPEFCEECARLSVVSPLDPESAHYWQDYGWLCLICWELLGVVNSLSYWRNIQAKWVEENKQLAAKKIRIMRPGRDDDDWR